MRYDIRLVAIADVSAFVPHIEAESQEEALQIAIEKAKQGNVSWDYDGVDTDSIEEGI